jgi:hypothetical protein
MIMRQGKTMGFSQKNEKDYLHYPQKKKRKLETTY